MMVGMGHFVRLSTSTRMWPFWAATVLFQAPNNEREMVTLMEQMARDFVEPAAKL